MNRVETLSQRTLMSSSLAPLQSCREPAADSLVEARLIEFSTADSTPCPALVLRLLLYDFLAAYTPAALPMQYSQ